MGIDDIQGAVSGLWAKAKSAVTQNLSAAPSQPPQSPALSGDSAHLANRDQYFSGYAQPTPGQNSELSLWAPLVITPNMTPSASPNSQENASAPEERPQP